MINNWTSTNCKYHIIIILYQNLNLKWLKEKKNCNWYSYTVSCKSLTRNITMI